MYFCNSAAKGVGDLKDGFASKLLGLVQVRGHGEGVEGSGSAVSHATREDLAEPKGHD